MSFFIPSVKSFCSCFSIFARFSGKDILSDFQKNLNRGKVSDNCLFLHTNTAISWQKDSILNSKWHELKKQQKQELVSTDGIECL